LIVTEHENGAVFPGDRVHEVVPHCIKEGGLLHPTTEGTEEEVTSEIENATSRATMKAV